METCLGESHLNWCIIYLDNIIIFSKTPQEHLKRLRGVFENFTQVGLKLKPSKCEFFRDKLWYLGHIVSEKGIATDPKKIEIILNWPRPKTVTDLRSFAGFTNYYHKYIKDYAKIARSLFELTSGENAKKKRHNIKWTDRCQQSFEQLKERCSQCPVLAYANYKSPFILHTDASTTGLGAVLSQKQADGTERVVAYASHSLNKAERNYDAHKLEFLALRWTVTDQFHEYLYRSPKFDVFTDNNPLMYILTKAKLDAMGLRWIASLGPYHFDLHYKPGKKNPADPLSRINWSSIESHMVKATFNLAQINWTRLTMAKESEGPKCINKGLRAGKGPNVWKLWQEEDPTIHKVKGLVKKGQFDTYKVGPDEKGEIQVYAKNQKDLGIIHDLVYRKAQLKDHDDLTYQFAVPPKYRKRALELIHDKFGYLGIDWTTSLMQDQFYWPHMVEDVRVHIQNCIRCIKFKQKESCDEMVCIEATYPLQLVHLDFLQIGSKKKDKGKHIYVLVVTDHFTQYAKAYVTMNQMAHMVAHVFINEYVANYGWPKKILTDQAKDFERKVFKELCDQALVKKLRMTPYHTQGNGQPERFNHTLLTMLDTLPLDS